MNSYELSRSFWDYSFEHPERIKPNHIALYFFAIEHCNRLGWKRKFGFPTSMALDAIGIKSYSVYKKTFDQLVDFGFIEVIEYSKNQYSANIIALKEYNKAPSKALDKALIKHGSKQRESTDQSISSIDKQVNKETKKQLNKEPKFNFKKSLLDLGVKEEILNDWLIVREKKKASNTETAFKAIKKQIELKVGKTANDCIEKATEKDWKGFSASWDWGEDESVGNEQKKVCVIK